MSVDVRGGAGLAALLGLGVLAAGMHGSSVQPGGEVPPLSESRRVNRQDCTRPIEDPDANLSCR